jgi:acyl carrier protein
MFDNKENIESEIINILSNILHIGDKSRITLTSNLVEDLGADSLDLIEIMIEIEDHFNISIPEKIELKNHNTVLDVIKIVEQFV